MTTIRFAWRATVAGLQHERSLIRELNRNPATLCGFSPLDYQDKPRVDNGKPDRTPQHGEPQLLPVKPS